MNEGGNIVLQFLCGNDAEACLIRWYSHSRWSHVDCVLPDGRLLGARMDGGVQIRDPHYMESGTPLLRVELPCTKEQEAAFYDFQRSQIGKPYDGEAIAGFIAGRDWRDPDSWFCSELQAAGLELAGVAFFPYALAVVANKIDPGDLLLAISARIDVLAFKEITT